MDLPPPLLADIPFFASLVAAVVVGLIAIIAVVGLFYASFYRKVKKGTALVITGAGGTRVAFDGVFAYPVLHRLEEIDISIKRIEIKRTTTNGLICKDNIRADIEVAFFVRVNNEKPDVLKVAQSIGCERASSEIEIRNLFDAKFSEALKTVGKRFDFIELYQERDTFRDEIINVIGTDLNGFVLDDCAIDYLEQTPVTSLDPDNILDAEGIKKITELTADQAKLANSIQREKEKVIKKQDVEAREAILELERQQADAEAKQMREILSVQAREEADAQKVQEEERLKSQRAKIVTDEELEIATENKEREVLVAKRNKERTDAVEQERVARDRELEVIERERITALKSIEKEKAVEVEKKNIQDVIRERVAVEKSVVEEQQKILDTEAFAGADREKQVAVTLAEKAAEEELIRKIKEAEAAKKAAELKADQELYEVVRLAESERQAAELKAQEILISAEAEQEASEKLAVAKKTLAEGVSAEVAGPGLGEAEVIGAKADAEAKGITAKADAMKKLNDAGKEHEEFKLTLDKQKTIDLAEIETRARIAAKHSEILAQALRSAKIDIVGGETAFFDRITQAIGQGKAVDRLVENSRVLSDVKETFFNGDPGYYKAQLAEWLRDYGVGTEDVKNLSLAALLNRLAKDAKDPAARERIETLLGGAERFGLSGEKVTGLLKSLG